jgi:hypothetical protein
VTTVRSVKAEGGGGRVLHQATCELFFRFLNVKNHHLFTRAEMVSAQYYAIFPPIHSLKLCIFYYINHLRTEYLVINI